MIFGFKTGVYSLLKFCKLSLTIFQTRVRLGVRQISNTLIFSSLAGVGLKLEIEYSRSKSTVDCQESVD